ncbi:MAG: helix-turn-helix domain-containing protein [Kibdelosporangium sp.]
MAIAASQNPGLRADALQNRVRIVEVAREAFAKLGTGVPMAEIARRAGVGVATLYRRFPTKESLVTEAFTDQITECAAVVHDALADPDPWRGFCTAIARVCEMQAVDKGFTAAFVTSFPDAVDFERDRARAEQDFADLVQRAKDAGKLRADFVRNDLILLMMANSGIVAGSAEATVAASRRLVAYLLQSFRADRAGPLPPSVPLGIENVLRSQP